MYFWHLDFTHYIVELNSSQFTGNFGGKWTGNYCFIIIQIHKTYVSKCSQIILSETILH
jgi:hypothetical protein